MREHIVNNESYKLRRTVCALLLLVALGGMTFLAAARTPASINITINNNSQREIRHVYLAVGDPNNWGPDQLGASAISSGGTFTLSNISCDAASIRVITEDQNGCFLYNTVSCGSNATWTITNSDNPDCGG
ncbi:MAG: hypothetical protein ACREA9_04575 [Pyrinomonadaceae bacterium]